MKGQKNLVPLNSLIWLLLSKIAKIFFPFLFIYLFKFACPPTQHAFLVISFKNKREIMKVAQNPETAY